MNGWQYGAPGNIYGNTVYPANAGHQIYQGYTATQNFAQSAQAMPDQQQVRLILADHVRIDVRAILHTLKLNRFSVV